MAANSRYITVQTSVSKPVSQVWKYWTDPQHIVQWNAASEEWHTPHAENDVSVGGKFTFRMEAIDGSAGFDLSGTYVEVHPLSKLSYALDDGRKVFVQFVAHDGVTTITETFEAEDINSAEMQKTGWQAIIDNFKRHSEAQSN